MTTLDEEDNYTEKHGFSVDPIEKATIPDLLLIVLH